MGVANCVWGLILIGGAVAWYFHLQRAVQNEANATRENYHYMLLSVRIIMIGLVPVLGVIFLCVGAHCLDYLHKKKTYGEKKDADA